MVPKENLVDAKDPVARWPSIFRRCFCSEEGYVSVREVELGMLIDAEILTIHGKDEQRKRRVVFVAGGEERVVLCGLILCVRLK